AVVHHDADLRVGERRVPLASLTVLELQEIALAEGQRVPTLRALFERYGKDGRFLVELKPCPTPRAGLLEFRVAALLTQFHLLGRSWALSFSADMLRRLKELEPGIETCLNFDSSTYRPSGKLLPEL